MTIDGKSVSALNVKVRLFLSNPEQVRACNLRDRLDAVFALGPIVVHLSCLPDNTLNDIIQHSREALKYRVGDYLCYWVPSRVRSL